MPKIAAEKNCVGLSTRLRINQPKTAARIVYPATRAPKAERFSLALGHARPAVVDCAMVLLERAGIADAAGGDGLPGRGEGADAAQAAPAPSPCHRNGVVT